MVGKKQGLLRSVRITILDNNRRRIKEWWHVFSGFCASFQVSEKVLLPRRSINKIPFKKMGASRLTLVLRSCWLLGHRLSTRKKPFHKILVIFDFGRWHPITLKVCDQRRPGWFDVLGRFNDTHRGDSDMGHVDKGVGCGAGDYSWAHRRRLGSLPLLLLVLFNRFKEEGLENWKHVLSLHTAWAVVDGGREETHSCASSAPRLFCRRRLLLRLRRSKIRTCGSNSKCVIRRWKWHVHVLLRRNSERTVCLSCTQRPRGWRTSIPHGRSSCQRGETSTFA